MKLYSVQPFTSERKYRKSLMRVYIRIPMSRGSATYRKHAATFQTGSISYHFLSATRTGSSPKDRVLITGFLGLIFTSATGAKLTCTPVERIDEPSHARIHRSIYCPEYIRVPYFEGKRVCHANALPVPILHQKLSLTVA